MPKGDNPVRDFLGELRELGRKVLDLLGTIWTGIAAIGKVILNAFGFLYISLWWMYCNLRLWLDPKLGRFS